MSTKRQKPTGLHRIFFFLLSTVVSTTFLPISVSAQSSESAGVGSLKQLRAWLEIPTGQRPDISRQAFIDVALSREQAAEAKQMLWKDFCQQELANANDILKRGVVTVSGYSMKFEAKVFGEKPARGHSLYLSLHGGGGAPKRVNDGQWENQKRLYTPEEGIYVAPRAPTDTWNMWHQAHVDPLLRKIIEAFVVTGQVNPNRVYLLGYSAGGDGVYQVAPRMADSLAAAAMMAGHPNDASPLGLRNIGFTIHMGANDSAYNRNQVARQWGQKLDDLQAQDSHGYPHETVIHEGKGHWMDRQDAIALDFLAGFDRQPNPDRVVWYQDDVTRDWFYWLAISPEQAKPGTTVTATVEDQTISIKTADLEQLTLRLSDDLIDLDQPIEFVINGKRVANTRLSRKVGNLSSTLQQTRDPNLAWAAEYELQVPKDS